MRSCEAGLQGAATRLGSRQEVSAATSRADAATVEAAPSPDEVPPSLGGELDRFRPFASLPSHAGSARAQSHTTDSLDNRRKVELKNACAGCIKGMPGKNERREAKRGRNAVQREKAGIG